MQKKSVKWMVGSLSLLPLVMLFIVSACSFPGSSSPTSNAGGNTRGSGNSAPLQQGTTTIATPASNTGNKNGPLVIASPSPVPGGSPHSQIISLQDRTLTITDITKKGGMDASSIAIALTITVKNIGTTSISNKASFYQLMGAEGDVFGLQSSVTPDFSGAIDAGASRSGTIVFQVPAAAATNLRLFYRSDQAQTVFAALNI